MKISINKPCHEDWDKMLPDEKGAFCLSCQKSVVDFSNKTLGQIKYFFNNKVGSQSVCGRFEESQLTALSFDDFFAEFKTWSFVRKVALIVFFVFGMTLFGNAQTKQKPKPKPRPEPQVIEPMIMGDIAYIPEDTIKKPCIKDTIRTEGTIKGKIKYVPENTPKKPVRSRKTMGEPEVEIK